jgi:hypothetical protein
MKRFSGFSGTNNMGHASHEGELLAREKHKIEYAK